MGLTLGVAALFFGVVFIIVGWKGGGTSAMNSNLSGMLMGQYPTESNVANTSQTAPNVGATSTTGGVHAPPSANQPGPSNK